MLAIETVDVVKPYPFELAADIRQMVGDIGSHSLAFDMLAAYVVEQAVSSGYISDVESCRDAANLLTEVSERADEEGDVILNALVGRAAELWEDGRTHQPFSFGIEVVKRDGHYVVWRPQ